MMDPFASVSDSIDVASEAQALQEQQIALREQLLMIEGKIRSRKMDYRAGGRGLKWSEYESLQADHTQLKTVIAQLESRKQALFRQAKSMKAVSQETLEKVFVETARSTLPQEVYQDLMDRTRARLIREQP